MSLAHLLILLSILILPSTSKIPCNNPNKWSSWTPCCCNPQHCGTPAHQIRLRNSTTTTATTTLHPASSLRGTKTPLTNTSSSYSQRADKLYCQSTFSVRLCQCENQNQTLTTRPSTKRTNNLVSYGTSLEQALLSLGVQNYTVPSLTSGTELYTHLYHTNGRVISNPGNQNSNQHNPFKHKEQRTRSVLGDVIRSLASFMYSFGGIVPFYPQYHRIRNTRNSKGFSTTVCLILLIAMILRIQFWMLKHFHVALLLQSVSMIGAQLLLLDLCISVRAEKETLEDNTLRSKQTFWTSPINHFWSWSEFSDYVSFILFFSIVTGTISKFFSFSSIYAEIIGSASVTVEAIILIPQCIQNYERQSTEGLSYAMIVMWTGGDFLKLTYLTASEVPVQFVICAITQCSIDVIVMLQISLYAESKDKKPVPLGRRLSRLVRSDVHIARRKKSRTNRSISMASSDEGSSRGSWESTQEDRSLLDASRAALIGDGSASRVKAR